MKINEKIKELKKSMNIYKSDCKACPHTDYAIYARRRYKELREELKELQMENKIIVELDIEDLKNICNSKEANIIKCDGCKQDIKTLIRCNLYCSNFKIKEQK